MRKIFPTGVFRRDVKRIARHKRDVTALYEIIECLRVGKELPLASRLHKLHGKYAGLWECHIENDWLLVYEINDEEVILARTGTHSDLFE